MRLLGLLPLATGAAAAAAAPVPQILVTGDGTHLAVVESGGTPRILRNRSGDFIRRVFAETSGFDGEPQVLEDAPFAACSHDTCVANVRSGGRNWRVLATRSTAWLEWRDLVEACGQADIVVSDRWLPRGCTPKWLRLDRESLGRTGGLAIYLGDTPRVVTVAEIVGEHPWATSRAK
jgi:competence protein ComEC